MMVSLLAAFAISLFAVCAGIKLLFRFSDWRIGFMAGLAIFAAAWVAADQIVSILATSIGTTDPAEHYGRANQTLALSVLTLVAIFFLERNFNARAKAQHEMQLAQIYLDRTKLPIFWFTPRGEISYANKGALSYLGYSAKELYAKTIHDIAPLSLPDDWRRDWVRLKRDGSTSMELNCLRKDGQIVPADVTAIYVGSEDSECSCMFFKDITEKKHAEAEAQIAMGKVERANRSKSEFLASMSHELRTPLNAINGFSEIIMNESYGPVGDKRYQEYAADIHNSGQHLLDLINDILDLSKVESGTDELREENIEIRDVINSVLGLVEERAEKKDLELELDVADDAAVLWADRRKVKQILINLMSNAIKFTPAGGKVTVRVWSNVESGYYFQVVDTGIGMEQEDIPKALTPFQQIDSAANRKYEGTGLGLPLTKSLVELHGGSMNLQSEVGAGTTVTVRFPADRVVSSSGDTKAVAV